MRDEQIAEVIGPAKIGQQIKDLRTHRYVQRADGFIKQDQRGADDQRPRNRDALALPAGKFMDVLARIRRGQANGDQGGGSGSKKNGSATRRATRWRGLKLPNGS